VPGIIAEISLVVKKSLGIWLRMVSTKVVMLSSTTCKKMSISDTFLHYSTTVFQCNTCFDHLEPSKYTSVAKPQAGRAIRKDRPL
jgi:hypothetical protein